MVYFESLSLRVVRKAVIALAPNFASHRFERQFHDFYAALNRHSVRYMVIGGTGVHLYCPDRRSLDLDILIERSVENAERVLRALRECNLPCVRLSSAQEIAANDMTIFSDRIKIDVLCRSRGIQFASAWPKHRVCYCKEVGSDPPKLSPKATCDHLNMPNRVMVSNGTETYVKPKPSSPALGVDASLHALPFLTGQTSSGPGS